MPDTHDPEALACPLPAGDYAIVEVLGHRTLTGRIAEIERFGTKFLQVEPLFGDRMLDPVLIGGSSIYQFTPASAEVCWARRPHQPYELPATIMATVPPDLLPAPASRAIYEWEDDTDD